MTTTCQQDLFIVLDSADRDLLKYPNPADYVVKPISEIRNCVAIEVMSIQVVRGETNVHSGNSQFLVNNTPVQLTLGEMDSPAALASNVQTAIRTATADNAYTVSFTSATYRFAVTHPTTAFTLTVTEGSARLLGLMGTGDRGSGTIASALVSGAQVVAGMRGINLLGEPYASLYLNDFERLNSPGSTLDGTFYTIPLENRKFMERFLVCSDEKERKGRFMLQTNQRNISQLRVRITRPDGSLYDFNGQDHIIVLRLTRAENKDYIS